ncbi:MAG: hypothetical protein R3F30_16210 [Planctomycetota bacterium]
MSRTRDITLPQGLYPGSAAARRALHAATADLGADARLRLGEAWMLEALLEQDHGRGPRCDAVPRYVRLDAFAPLAFDDCDLALGGRLVETLCGARAERPEHRLATGEREPTLPRAGLCLEQRRLAARLAATLGPRLVEDAGVRAVLPDLLPALSPAGLGGLGSPETERRALAVLRDAAASLGVGDDDVPLFEGGRALPRRVPRQELRAADLVLGWARSRGLSWAPGGLRPCLGLGNLEVQGDLSAGGDAEALAFAPGHPPRPRVYEAAHMQPVRLVDDGDRVGLELERLLEIPSDPEAAGGRKRAARWRLAVCASKARRELRLRVELDGLPAGMRYRLRVPLPFWPRPTRLARVLDDGRREPAELEGPFGLEAVDGPLECATRGLAVRVDGAGVHEVELCEVANDCVLAITLLRRRDWDPDRIARELTVSWS